MRAFEFLIENDILIIESPSDDVIADLSNLGYRDFKTISGKKVAVLVPSSERKNTFNNILAELPGAKFNPVGGGSSLGSIEYKGASIIAKPSGKQGDESAGLENEKHLIRKINEFVSEIGPLDITFVGDNGVSVTARGVTEAVGAGKDTKGRKKSDVNLVSGGTSVPISIKKRTAEFWESADTYFGKQADEIITKLAKEKLITLTPVPGMVRQSDKTPIVSISPEVAIETTDQQSVDLVFGSDILAGNGAVIKETFEDEHYTLEGNKLTVTCDLVIKEPKDIPDELKVYIQIRNNKSRNRPGSPYPGTRVIAVYASRVKRSLIVDPQGNPKS
jgi:hypothetical protein